MKPSGSRLDQLEFLSTTPFLAGIREENLISLANAARFVKVDKGSYLFHQHESADSLYILRSGEMAVVLSSIDGREMIINEIRPGECFGEVSLLTMGVRTAGAQARENSEVLRIGSGTFLAVLDAEPKLARRMLEIATQRLYKAHQRESALAFLDAPARIARVLKEMDEADRQGLDKGYITLSQDELAQRTGLTRQTVARELGRWRRQGWLLTGRGRIMLLNRNALHRIEEENIV